MRIVHINSVAHGSTGKIMLNIAETVKKMGHEAYTFSESRREAYAPDNHRFFGDCVENMFHRGFSMISGISGKGSCVSTWRLLRELDKISPDILHLHNLHGWYINIPMLFDYIRRNKIKTIWTLHDCWAFTAQCSHFTMEKCEKWRNGCYSCPRYKIYPYTLVDRTRMMWQLKKQWFSGIDGMTIVTPSRWLSDLVGQSFLKDYSVCVINNGIDLSVFKPTQSDFREKYSLTNKKIVLGVAAGWTNRKGLDVFIELSKRLDPIVYKIVLVGTDSKVDNLLPKEIISIHRTQNPEELADIYSAADVFVNPTREENYPTVNMESIACGTPVVTFDVGGCAEMINGKVGILVEPDNIDEMFAAIEKTCNEQFYDLSDFIVQAETFRMEDKFTEYIRLYNSIAAHDGG